MFSMTKLKGLTRNATERAPASRFERRWPVVLTLMTVIAILAVLPDTIRLFPLWMVYALGIAVLAPIAAVGLSAATSRSLRIEHAIILIFVVVAGAALLLNLANLTGAMIYRSVHTSGLQLLTSSIGLWITNILVFSLLYWRLDRGGPEARANDVRKAPDWLFPQENAPSSDPPHGWHPTFVDYLYLGYSTATAFSTTDTTPLTARAKLLMMLQATISLLTIVLVASRAINILGN
jgi:uncharacterized membrane protein